MTLAALAPMITFREFTNAGAPAAGYKLYTAQPGTVAGPSQSYPKSTYTDGTSGTPNANPVVLNSSGFANVWLIGAYSMALYDAAGTLVRSTDNVAGSGSQALGATTEFIFGDATNGTYNANILAANDPAAPDIYEIAKLDPSANYVHITPVTGTVDGAASYDLQNQKESVRLKKYAPANDWMVAGK